MRDFVLTRLALFAGTVVGTAVALSLLLDLLPGAGGATPNSFGERLAVTLPLALLALIIAGAVGIGLGLAAGRYRGTIIDRLIRGGSAVLTLLPPFWLGMLLALVFASLLKLLPASGFVPWGNSIPGALASLLLPALALGLPYAGQMALRIRRDLAETPPAEVLHLRANGLTAQQATWQTGLARALPELPEILARTFGALLIGAALVESVFYLPGLGRQILGAAEQHDLALLRGALFVLILVTAFGMLLFAMLRLLIDPALRPELRQ
jgi:peptide/nickel transport system permease protein